MVSLLRDRDDAVSGLQLTFVDVTGAASAKAPKRQTYAFRSNGVRDGLFRAGGGEGRRRVHHEGCLEKAIAVASLGIGPVYGAGGRAILGCAATARARGRAHHRSSAGRTVVDLQTSSRLRPTTGI